MTERGLGYRFVGGVLSKAGEAMAKERRLFSRRNALLAVACVLCLVGILVAAFYWNAKPVAAVGLDGQFLVAYDASGKPLWRISLRKVSKNQGAMVLRPWLTYLGSAIWMVTASKKCFSHTVLITGGSLPPRNRQGRNCCVSASVGT